MTNADAYRTLLDHLTTATEAQARDVRDILRLGAGDLGLPEGAVMTAPGGLPAERRHAYCSLVDGIRYLGGGDDPDGEYHPVRAGSWEPVLAALVIDGEWDQIRAVADDLRTDTIRRAVELLVETKDVCRDARLWEARMALERLL